MRLLQFVQVGLARDRQFRKRFAAGDRGRIHVREDVREMHALALSVRELHRKAREVSLLALGRIPRFERVVVRGHHASQRLRRR